MLKTTLHLNNLLGRSLHAENEIPWSSVRNWVLFDVNRELVLVCRIEWNFADFRIEIPKFRRIPVDNLSVLDCNRAACKTPSVACSAGFTNRLKKLRNQASRLRGPRRALNYLETNKEIWKEGLYYH